MPGDFLNPEERIDLSPEIGNETKTTTCYMCACRCGIKVHLRDGQIRYIEGNKDHPVNKGVLVRQGIRWDHAALFAGAPDQAAETKRPARLGRVRGN